MPQLPVPASVTLGIQPEPRPRSYDRLIILFCDVASNARSGLPRSSTLFSRIPLAFTNDTPGARDEQFSNGQTTDRLILMPDFPGRAPTPLFSMSTPILSAQITDSCSLSRVSLATSLM